LRVEELERELEERVQMYATSQDEDSDAPGRTV